MFEIHPEIKFIQASREQIVSVIESINSPMVAAGNKPLEPARVIILGVRNPNGTFTIYLYLHLLQSKECQVYLHETLQVPLEAFRETEAEALGFAESMGFMVDNLNFRKMDAEQQTALMQRLPVFSPDLEAFARRTEVAEEVDENSPAVEEVIDLDEVAEASVAKEMVLSEEGLAKIVRLLSSF